MIIMTQSELAEFKDLKPSKWDTDNFVLKLPPETEHYYPQYKLINLETQKTIVDAFWDSRIDQCLFPVNMLAQCFARVADLGFSNRQQALLNELVLETRQEYKVVRAIELEIMLVYVAGLLALDRTVDTRTLRHARYQTLKLALFLEELVFESEGVK